MLSLIVVLLSAATVLAAPPDDRNCGVPAIKPNTRIVGGTEARPNSWPWMIQTLIYGSQYCGASLLSSDWILTAAHCLAQINPQQLVIKAGRHKKDGKETNEQTSSPKTSIIHESYSTTQQNDIALIRLNTPFTINSYVKPICLPSRTTPLPHGTMTYVTGWGHTKDGGPLATALRQVNVPIIETKKCNEPKYYFGAIKPGMMCAGHDAGGKDACQYDSGGPLVAEVNGRWEQFGVVSWGAGCAEPMKPGVYSDVVYYNNWIRSKVKQIEREEEEVAAKFQPVPAGSAFRELSKQLVEEGAIDKDDLPNGGAWLN